MRIADEQEGQGETHAVPQRREARHYQRMKRRLQQLVDAVFAGPPQAEAGERHSRLRHGKQTRWICKQSERRLRAHVSLFGQRAQSALAYRHQRDLGCGEEPVEQQHRGQNHEAVGHKRARTRR